MNKTKIRLVIHGDRAKTIFTPATRTQLESLGDVHPGGYQHRYAP